MFYYSLPFFFTCTFPLIPSYFFCFSVVPPHLCLFILLPAVTLCPFTVQDWFSFCPFPLPFALGFHFSRSCQYLAWFFMNPWGIFYRKRGWEWTHGPHEPKTEMVMSVEHRSQQQSQFCTDRHLSVFCPRFLESLLFVTLEFCFIPVFPC